MTELSFLVDLLLNHKLAKATKDAVATRIKEVEASMAQPILRQQAQVLAPVNLHPEIAKQAPSMQAIMLRHGDIATNTVEMRGVPVRDAPVAVVAQTQATAAAMASRQQAIAEQLSGKIDKVSGRPRKF